MIVFWLSFLILTVLHPISDFIIRNKISVRAHWISALNPLHYLWDYYFAKHNEFIDPDYNVEGAETLNLSLVNNDHFWVWLGVDQTIHVFQNILLAILLELIF